MQPEHSAGAYFPRDLKSTQAGMAELADALDLGSSAVKGVQVQVLFPAPQLTLYCFNSIQN